MLRRVALRGRILASKHAMVAAPSVRMATSKAPTTWTRNAVQQTRQFTKTRAQWLAEKPPAGMGGGEAGAGEAAQDALVLTPYQKVTATAKGGLWLGFIGLGVAGVYIVVRELLPNRMSPNGLFSESMKLLQENTDVTTRLGLPIRGYGHDYGGKREGRRNRVEHVKLKDKDGKPRMRIKYNLEGPSGHAFVFAEVNQDMKKGEYVYLIAQFTKTNEVINIIDNRQILSAETKEEQDALRRLLGKGE